MIDRSRIPDFAGGWLWAIYASGVAAVFLASALTGILETPVTLLISTVSALILATAIYMRHPIPRDPLRLLAAAQLAFALGDVAGLSVSHLSPAAPFPSLAAIFYFAAYPAATLGFALLVAHRNPGPGIGVLLDGGILTVGVGLVAWVVVADPLFAISTLTQLDRAVVVVHLIADIALVGVVACLVLDAELGTTSDRLFAAGVASLVVADALGASGAGGLQHQLSLAAYAGQAAFWAAAALHPSIPLVGRQRVTIDHGITLRRLAAMMAAALVAPAILVAQGLTGHIDFPAISLGSVAIVALVIATMADLIGEQSAAMQKRLGLEVALRETSETLRAILDSSPLPIVVVDRKHRVLFWSRSAEQLFGWSTEEVQARRLPILPAREGARTVLTRVLAGESPAIEELTCRTREGQVVKVRAHFAPIRDDAGKVRSTIFLMEDTSQVEVLKEAPGADINDFLVGIRDAAERAAGLTQQLLAFSRHQIPQPGDGRPERHRGRPEIRPIGVAAVVAPARAAQTISAPASNRGSDGSNGTGPQRGRRTRKKGPEVEIGPVVIQPAGVGASPADDRTPTTV